MALNDSTPSIPGDLAIRQVPVDPPVRPLVDRLNGLPGVRTLSSCGGHPDRYPYVLLTTDGTSQALESLCFIAHALRSYRWKLVAVPIGSVGDLYLQFVVLPGLALREWDPDQAALGIRASDYDSVRLEQAKIVSLSGRLQALARDSRYLPEGVGSGAEF